MRSLPSLRVNILALGLMQAANYLIPLVTIPYLARTLGVQGYGKMVFVQAVMAYFVILIEYGFSWSATKRIAMHREDYSMVSKIFSENWVAQWGLAAIAGLILFGGAVLIKDVQDNLYLYVFGFISVVGTAVFPIWLLQGLEKMKEVAVINVAGRLCCLPALFFFVKGPDDNALAIFILSFSVFVSGVISLLFLFKNKIVEFSLPSVFGVVSALKEGFFLFSSKAVISIYTIMPPLVVGALSGAGAVGHFSLADKLRAAAQGCLLPVSQALFPRMSHLYSIGSNDANAIVKKSLALVCFVSLVIGFVLFWFSGEIVRLVGGEEFISAKELLQWMAFVPFFVGISNIFGVQILLANGKQRHFNGVLMSAGFVGLLLIFPMVIGLGALGAVVTVLLCEIFVSLLMVFFVFKFGYIKF